MSEAAVSVLTPRRSSSAMLVVLSGLPGVGKTTIARELVRRWPCAYVRIDAIEQALKTLNAQDDGGPAGYVVAYELARSNLALGVPVLADCVNPLAITRAAWRAVAASTSAGLLEVEVVCSDTAEHRRRVEERRADIAGHQLPQWDAVCGHAYEPWTRTRLVVDSARISATKAADLIVRAVQV